MGDNRIKCEECNCYVQSANWNDHVNGRRHRQNAASSRSAAPPRPSRHSHTHGGGGGGARMGGVSMSAPSPHSSMGNTDTDDDFGGGMKHYKMCPMCTMMNIVEAQQCRMCHNSLRDVDVIHLAPNSHLGNKQTVWHCRNCEHTNPLDAPTCCVCGFSEADTTAKRKRDYVDVDKDEPLCVICMARPQSHVILPCRHTCLCGDCAVKIAPGTPCILCRVPVEAIAVANGPLAPKHPVKGIVAPVLGDDGRKYASSTFPWVGGSVHRWDYFLDECTNATLSFAQQELDYYLSRGMATIERCRQSEQCLSRFKEGWKQLACPEGSWAGVCGWHCNKSYSTMGAIAQGGWDPTRRKRNLHGEGEYFGMHHSQVIEYSDSNHRWVIVAFILRGSHVSMVEDYCFVVNNPADDKYERDHVTFCLPVAIVKFTTDPLKWAVPRHPYRWQFGWESDEDDANYINFEPTVSRSLSEHLTMYFATRNARHIKVQVGMNVGDGRGDVNYEIDLKSFTQRNLQTGFVRKITMIAMPATRLPKTLWMMLHQRDYWIILDFLSQRTLTDAYMAYHHPPNAMTTRSGVRKPADKRMVQLLLHAVQHTVDLETMQLKNHDTGVSHAIAVVDA